MWKDQDLLSKILKSRKKKYENNGKVYLNKVNRINCCWKLSVVLMELENQEFETEGLLNSLRIKTSVLVIPL